MKPKAIDLFCGAGGATRGLQLAGFHVTGVDHRPQPRYVGDAFVQADALRPPFDLAAFDFVWASPPCQAYSEATPLAARKNHLDLIETTRALLESHPCWVIENVDGARRLLRNPFMLCGTMFGLKVWRHRWFESPSLPFNLLPPCNHAQRPILINGSGHGRGEASPSEMIAALSVPWMRTRAPARQAIPPAYAEHIGKAALAYLNGSAEPPAVRAALRAEGGRSS